MLSYINFDKLDDRKYINTVLEKTYRVIVDNPISVPFIKNMTANINVLLDFYYNEVRNNKAYILIGFYDSENPNIPKELPIGVALFSITNCWFLPPDKLALVELVTASLVSKRGISRKVRDFMTTFAEQHKDKIKVVISACLNTPYAKAVENCYRKGNFKVYSTFYKEII